MIWYVYLNMRLCLPGFDVTPGGPSLTEKTKFENMKCGWNLLIDLEINCKKQK